MAKTRSNGGGSKAELGSPIKGGLTKAQFESIYREGKRVSGAFCRLMARTGTGKIGFATPRAVGNTPRRNRLKRRFRAVVCNVDRPPNLDLVVAISTEADRATSEELRQDLERTMRRMTERWANESESSS